MSSSPRQVTQRDVADALGISHASVSLALRNSPKITAERRQQIQCKAEEMGYRLNPAAAALAHHKRSSTTVPVHAALAWFNFWEDPAKLYSYAEFNLYWKGARAAAEKLGYHLDEFVYEKNTSMARLEKILLNRGISGVLLPPHRRGPDWGNFDWNRFSAIRYGRSVKNPSGHIVTADQVANTMMAFDAIRERGYRRVGFVSSASRTRGHLFEAGFLMAQRFIPKKEAVSILNIDDTQPEPRVFLAEIRKWLDREKPDAVLTDIIFVPELIRETGRRIPEDLGVAATTVLDARVDAGVYQNPEEIGRIGVLTLASLIWDNDCGVPDIPREILVRGKWVDGSSLPAR